MARDQDGVRHTKKDKKKQPQPVPTRSIQDYAIVDVPSFVQFFIGYYGYHGDADLKFSS